MCLEESKPLNLLPSSIKSPDFFNVRSSPWNTVIFTDLFSPLCLVKDVVNQFSTFLITVCTLLGKAKGQGFKVSPHLYLQPKFPPELGLVFPVTGLELCTHTELPHSVKKPLGKHSKSSWNII